MTPSYPPPPCSNSTASSWTQNMVLWNLRPPDLDLWVYPRGPVMPLRDNVTRGTRGAKVWLCCLSKPWVFYLVPSERASRIPLRLCTLIRLPYHLPRLPVDSYCPLVDAGSSLNQDWLGCRLLITRLCAFLGSRLRRTRRTRPAVTVL